MQVQVWSTAAALVVAFVLLAGEANAAGGFNCRAHDNTVAFEIGGSTERSSGRISQASGMIQIRNGASTASISERNIPQFWHSETELRLSMLIEQGLQDVIRLSISARGREGEYTGTYALQAGGLSRSGRVACSAE